MRIREVSGIDPVLTTPADGVENVSIKRPIRTIADGGMSINGKKAGSGKYINRTIDHIRNAEAGSENTTKQRGAIELKILYQVLNAAFIAHTNRTSEFPVFFVVISVSLFDMWITCCRFFRITLY
ncbi:hypothetical protein JXJ21_18885 [candidate division KSB1 bacterium]|nr:hypothetical protein [candidate division KSB1 bacterium]